jgi:hypothetical protein
MRLIPPLESLFIRDLIRRGEREGRKIEAVREDVQVRIEKESHASESLARSKAGQAIRNKNVTRFPNPTDGRAGSRAPKFPATM